MVGEVGGQGSGGYVVRSREGREEVVESYTVSQVDGGELEAPAVLGAVEEVVLADREVEEAALGYAGWVAVVILGAWGGNGEEA